MSEHVEDAVVERLATPLDGSPAKANDKLLMRAILSALKPGDSLPGGFEVVSSAELRALRERIETLPAPSPCTGVST